MMEVWWSMKGTRQMGLLLLKSYRFWRQNIVEALKGLSGANWLRLDVLVRKKLYNMWENQNLNTAFSCVSTAPTRDLCISYIYKEIGTKADIQTLHSAYAPSHTQWRLPHPVAISHASKLLPIDLLLGICTEQNQ